MLPDFERADRIGEFWGYPPEPRIRRSSDRLRGGRTLRAVLVAAGQAPASARKVYNTLSAILRSAVVEGVISKSMLP